MALPINEPTNFADMAPEKQPWSRPELIELSSDMDDVRLGAGPMSDGFTTDSITFSFS